jgi:hypothetical protein
MKRILIGSICGLVIFFFLNSCGETKVVKQDNSVGKQEQKQTYDRMNDTAFSNVMAVLREALEDEKQASDSSTKLKTAKAYILVIKFIRTDRDKVQRTGMTETDINFLVSDAKEKAQNRLKEIMTSQTSPQSIKDEANAKSKELETL